MSTDSTGTATRFTKKFDELPPEIRAKVIETNRGINLVERWEKGVTDRWEVTLSQRGFTVNRFHFFGFYKKGSGASFEAEVNLLQFIQAENVRRMIKAGVDIMFIRKIRELHKQIAEDVKPWETWKVESKKAQFPKFRVNRKPDAEYYNQESMVCVSDKGKEVDEYTRKQLEAYILSRAVHFSTRYFSDLKKLYDKLITDEAVSKTLRVMKYRRYDEEGNSINVKERG